MTVPQLQGVIRWEAPPDIEVPTIRRPHRVWAVVAQDLRDNPGRWGVIDEDCGNSASVTSRINKGQAQWWLPAGAFFAVQRTVGGVINVYGVFLGENHEYAARAGVQSHLNRVA